MKKENIKFIIMSVIVVCIVIAGILVPGIVLEAKQKSEYVSVFSPLQSLKALSITLL